MNWTAIVPLNWGRDCKTRLADRLSRAERDTLVADMARQVVSQLLGTPGISDVLILSPNKPQIEGARWLPDGGENLNDALQTAMSDGPALVIHADLPGLASPEVEDLLTAAHATGVSIAPDRAETGTNALALLAPDGIRPIFGPDSFARHRALFPNATIVKRPGLAFDVDTPEDLDLLRYRLVDMT